MFTRDWAVVNYNKFNQEVFGGFLPRIVPGSGKDHYDSITIEIIKRQAGFAGKAWYFSNRQTGQVGYRLILNGYYDFNEEVMIPVLLHEMVHILDYISFPAHRVSRFYDAHGSWFMKEADRIFKLTGYQITKTLKGDFETSSKDEMYLILMNGYMGKSYPVFFVMKSKEFNKVTLDAQFLHSDNIVVYKSNKGVLPASFSSCKVTTANRYNSWSLFLYRLKDSDESILENEFTIIK